MADTVQCPACGKQVSVNFEEGLVKPHVNASGGRCRGSYAEVEWTVKVDR